MSKLSSKRQITLPIDQFRELGIEPGDELECYVANGQLTLVKKGKGAAKGSLSHIKVTVGILTNNHVRMRCSDRY